MSCISGKSFSVCSGLARRKFALLPCLRTLALGTQPLVVRAEQFGSRARLRRCEALVDWKDVVSDRCFSSVVVTAPKTVDTLGLVKGTPQDANPVMRFKYVTSRMKATVGIPAEQEGVTVKTSENASSQKPGEKMKRTPEDAKMSDDMVVSDYWGITPKKFVRGDGTPWPWNSFRPLDAYAPDTSIDLKKHHKPRDLLDTIAYWTVKVLRVPTDIFFQKRYGCRAMMLETVAAVPGMVGGMLLHFKSLRKFEHSGGWIKALLEEAENERMHLMTFMEVAKPRWYERALVFIVQGIFFNAYFLAYIVSPRLCHRITGYLEEEAIHSYTMFLDEIHKGTIKNTPAPAIAIDYWRLNKEATLKDVVQVVRADEAHHRDVNHFAAASIAKLFHRNSCDARFCMEIAGGKSIPSGQSSNPYSCVYLIVTAGYPQGREATQR
eukprot:c28087_g1_i2 orf=167-1474(+)